MVPHPARLIFGERVGYCSKPTQHNRYAESCLLSNVGFYPSRKALEQVGACPDHRGCGSNLRPIPSNPRLSDDCFFAATRLFPRLSPASGALLLDLRRAHRGLLPLPRDLSWRSGRPRMANFSPSRSPASDCRCRSEHFGLAYRSCRPARQLDDGSIGFWTDSRSNCSAAGVFLNGRTALRSACRFLPRTHCCGLLRPLRSRV